MASRVVIQVLLPRETLAANRAVVRLVGGVSLHMTFQRGRVRKDMKADRAGKHRPAQMTLAVTRQIVRVGERFAAHLKNSSTASWFNRDLGDGVAILSDETLRRIDDPLSALLT